MDLQSKIILIAGPTASGKSKFAIKLAKKATLIEEKLPAPSGPPRILKPSYELLGEVYLKADKPVQAQEKFYISLLRHPNRIRSLVGIARASNANRNRETAIESYQQLLHQYLLLMGKKNLFSQMKIPYKNTTSIK